MAQNGFQSFVARLLGSGTGPNLPLNLNANGELLVAAQEQDVQYIDAPASATTALGVAGAIGDVLSKLTIIPAVAACGSVQIKDGTNAAITVFAGGGTTALPSLAPITISLDAPSTNGGWSVICGANVQAIASGQFA